MIEEREIRTSYLRGLATLRSTVNLEGPNEGMYWLMPFAVAVCRSDGKYSQFLNWPDYDDLSDRERKAAELIRAALSNSRSALIDYGGYGGNYDSYIYAIFSINEKWKNDRRKQYLDRSFLDNRETDIRHALYNSPTYCAVALVDLLNQYGLNQNGDPVDPDPDEHNR